MKKIEYTFYRPAEVNTREFYDIVEKLREDLHTILNEKVSKKDVRAYAGMYGQGILGPWIRWLERSY